jgi:poly(3-hydroxybutyrate) depolymerase
MKFSKALPLLVIMTASRFSLATTATTTTLSSSLNPSTYGQAVTFTAVVSSADGAPPNGETVNFMQGSNTLGSGTLSGGTATFTTSTLAASSADDVRAVYGGDSNFGGSTSNTVAQQVNQATSSTTLVSGQNPSNVGQAVTFTATVKPEFSGTVTGYVRFYNGTSQLGRVALSGGSASYTTTNLAAGTDSITATYLGTTDFLTSTSSVLGQTVDSGTILNETMTWDGVTRYYLLFVPTVLPPNPPLLVMLHGTTYEAPPNNPSTESWGWQTLANANGFILVQPASTYNANTNQWNWNSYFMSAAFTPAESGTCTSPPATSCPDDAGFLRQLIVNLTDQYNVNPNMVFVTGFSSGAQMSERVGVEISDLVAAISPSSGQMEGQQTEPPPVLAPGNVVAPVSVLEWHGTADTELPPCNYGTTEYSRVTYYLDTVDDTFNYWVNQNNCTVLQTTQTLCTNGEATPGLSGNTATSCVNSDIEVQFVWVEGLGHAWQTTKNTARWQFFAAHPKP